MPPEDDELMERYRTLFVSRPWTQHGLCVDHPEAPKLWFPTRGEPVRPGKKICNGDDETPPCPVRDECRDWGIRHEKFGIWGGLTEIERRRERKRLGVRSEAGGPRVPYENPRVEDDERRGL